MLDLAFEILCFNQGPDGAFGSFAAACMHADDVDVHEYMERLLALAMRHPRPEAPLQTIQHALRVPQFAGLPAAQSSLALLTQAALSLAPSPARFELLAGTPGFDPQAAMQEVLITAAQAAPDPRGRLPLPEAVRFVLRQGQAELAAPWCERLAASTTTAPDTVRLGSLLLCTECHQAMRQPTLAQRSLAQAVDCIIEINDERQQSWAVSRLVGAMFAGHLPLDPLALQRLVADTPGGAHTLAHTVADAGQPWSTTEGRPLATLVAILDALALTTETQALLVARTALEWARAGDGQACLQRLQRGITLREAGASVELHDMVGDLPQMAPLGEIAAALGPAVLAVFALPIGELALKTPSPEERLHWVEAWTLALARGGCPTETRRQWHAMARRIVALTSNDLAHLPHMPQEVLGTVAAAQIRTGEHEQGLALFLALEEQARMPTKGVLAARRMRALASIGELEQTLAGRSLPPVARLFLAEDLLRDGHPRQAAALMQDLEAHLSDRLFFVAQEAMDRGDSQDWPPLLAALKALPMPRHPMRHRQCLVILMRLALRHGEAGPARDGLRRMATAALAAQDRQTLFLVFQAIVEAKA